MASHRFERSRSCIAWSFATSLAGLLMLAAARMSAAEMPAIPPTSATITDAVQIWAMPSAEKSIVHPLRLEGRVNYYDALWREFWLEKDGVSTYIQLAAAVPPLQSGQRVVIEGTIVPVRGLEPDRVTVKVLHEYDPITPLPTKGRINDMMALGSRIVTADAYVDGQQYIDAGHVRLALIIENRPVVGWVKPDNPEHIPDWQGRFVHLVGLYSGRFDPTGTQTTIELYVSRQADLTVTGTIDDNALFNRPETRISDIYQLALGSEVRVRGLVASHESGTSMVIRDGTGQIELHSIQTQRLAIGAPVEAVGQITVSGPKWILAPALYRTDRSPATSGAGDRGVLTNIDQIRQLSTEEAAEGRRLRIAGMVTWSLPDSNFFFLQDLSGGIRVRFHREVMPPPPILKYLRIEGVTTAGDFLPTVELQHSDDLGAMSPPDAKTVTFEQVSSGKEDGQWVQMRGFMQGTVSDGDWRWVHVTTPSGEFVGHLQSPVNFVANPGSLIRVRGVCETTADANGRSRSVFLRVPRLEDIVIEEDAPADVFDLPLRSIKSVNQLSGGPNMMRVRVAGTVAHAVPGHLLYAQENDSGLLLLSRDKQPLNPGDKIEAVGILGREGVRTILREALFRNTGSGPAPAPALLRDPARLAVALDARLVRVRGTLIDTLHRPGHTRLSMQTGGTLFEAVLDTAGPPPPLAIGEGLELTGIYRLTFDDSGESRGFQLQLRSADDVVIFRHARLWTLERALIVCGILAAVTLLGLAWITALRRRVRDQTGQIRAQLERQALLEVEVQRAARLESLGTLAGGMAHDFNNLLTIVLGNVTLAMSDEHAMDCAGEYLREIERGARRARELTQQLLTFARGGDPLRAAVALPEIVRQAVALVLHGTSVRCEYDLAPDLWPAHVDRDQIAQAIQNLALNAVQAMPQGGVLRVSLRNEPIAAGAKPGLAAGRYVKLVVADTGEGIRPENLPRIFDPYFTTRKARSGLGLATVYSILRKHQGRIEAESTPGQGATFRVWLPTTTTLPAPVEQPASTAAPTRPAAVESTAPAQPKSRPRVLVMDDEESIRRVVEIVLRRMGVEPSVVADGAAAIREFNAAREAGRPFDLLILDLTIPGGMGGRRVMEIVRETDPLTPAIVSSGYSNDPVLANYVDYGFQAMVQKPYDVRQFAGVIGQFVGVTKPAPAASA